MYRLPEFELQLSNRQFPLPRIDELLAHLWGSKIFSKLHLYDGYHQIPIVQEDCHKTAFNCRYGAFEFRVIQFGLKNAPAHFQQTMNQLFADMDDVCVLVYLDNILIFSKKKEEHKQHIHAVFKRLMEQGFHIKCKKSTLFIDSIEFLGHIVSARGIEIRSNRLMLSDIGQLHLVLGMYSYFQDCVIILGILSLNSHMQHNH